MFAPTAAGCSMYKVLVAHHSTISCQPDLVGLNWAGRGQQWSGLLCSVFRLLDRRNLCAPRATSPLTQRCLCDVLSLTGDTALFKRSSLKYLIALGRHNTLKSAGDLRFSRTVRI